MDAAVDQARAGVTFAGRDLHDPPADVDVTDAIGRKWQCATFQLDYQMPERFDLKYIGADNAEHRPVVIHRAIFGSFERFIAILIERVGNRQFDIGMASAQAIILLVITVLLSKAYIRFFYREVK